MIAHALRGDRAPRTLPLYKLKVAFSYYDPLMQTQDHFQFALEIFLTSSPP